MGKQLKYKFGVYILPNAKLVYLGKPMDKEDLWADYILHDGRKKRHPFFRMTYELCYRSQGDFFIGQKLRRAEYLGELCNRSPENYVLNGMPPSMISDLPESDNIESFDNSLG